MELRYTLVSDGSSDAVLLPILTWLLREHGVVWAIQPEWADLRGLPKPPRTLLDKIYRSLDLYPCDMLFVHRDAEGEPREVRVREIEDALRTVRQSQDVPAICVIPVRMTEAWLLLDEAAIRSAAGNPFGRIALGLPPLRQLEDLPDPKVRLHELLRQASALSGRRLRRFRVEQCVRRLTEFLEDFSPLRQLPAFIALEEDVACIIAQQSWTG